MEWDEKDWFQNQIRRVSYKRSWTCFTEFAVIMAYFINCGQQVYSLEEAPSGLFLYNSYDWCSNYSQNQLSQGVFSLVRYVGEDSRKVLVLKKGIFLDKREMPGWLKSKGAWYYCQFFHERQGFYKELCVNLDISVWKRDGVQHNGQTYLPREHMKTHPQRPRGSLLGNWKSAPFLSTQLTSPGRGRGGLRGWWRLPFLVSR